MNSLSKPIAHVVDILGNVIGRDQPLMLMEKAILFAKGLEPEIYKNDNYVFFDPFCKAGEFLLSCAFLSCKYKQGNRDLIDLDIIQKELYETDRYFALAPDERHHRLSLRTFLGNKLSHDKRYNHIIRDGHYLSEEDGTLNKEKFETEFKSMIEYIKSKGKNKKIIAIGNPPYQENYKGDGSNTGANPIYHIFLDAIIKSNEIDQFLMVLPSRWFAGGRGKALRTFAEDLRKSGKIKQVYDFQNSKTVFPTVDIKGGVCFLHWDKNYLGKTSFFNSEDKTWEVVDLAESEIIIRDKISRSIVEKIQKKSTSFVSEIAWSWNPFNLASNYFDRNQEDKNGNVLDCLTKRGIIKKIARNKITKNSENIDKYKIAYPKAVSKGGIPHRPDQIFILEKGQICTETYMVIDSFTEKSKAEHYLKYLQSDFVRFLVSIKKITQDMTKETWCLVPILTLKENWTEKDIYKYFDLNKTEIDFIKEKVQQW